jgi:hypothetical protein
LLVSWGVTKVASMKTGVTFSGGNSKYTIGVAGAARTALTTAVGSGGKGWTISDGGGV